MDNNRAQEKDARGKIQIEQIKLLKTEKVLKELLTKINENINSLKVEELQLKANAITLDIKPILEEPTTVFKSEYSLTEVQAREEINKQNLFLDVFGQPMIDQQEYDSDSS